MAPNPIADGHEQQDKDVLVYDAPGFFAPDSRVPRWLQSVATDLFSFVILHYFVWGCPSSSCSTSSTRWGRVLLANTCPDLGVLIVFQL